jgi:hypothetical protein
VVCFTLGIKFFIFLKFGLVPLLYKGRCELWDATNGLYNKGN